MYKVSIPITVTENLNKEDILTALQMAKADCIFLAINYISAKKEINVKLLAPLKEFIPFFKSHGYTVGVWFWSLWISDLDNSEITDCVMINSAGKPRLADTPLNSNEKITSGFICPTSQKAVSYMTDMVRSVAALSPDIILFDDDLDYATHMNSIGCYCDRHLKLIEKRLGYPITREELRKEVSFGKPNRVRSLWYSLLGETLEEYAVKIRETVDSVNPKVRFGLCSVMSLWGTDGTTPEKIVKLLAGNTRPFMRLTGAPYWPALNAWGSRLQHVVELSRMECAWVEDKNIEILTEGDVYPRPRHKVPANFLEIFDTALRAAGAGNGIMKYMLDYTSSVGYETGYLDRHIKNEEIYTEIERIFGDKTETGVRVYEAMNKVTEADFTGIDDPEHYASEFFFSVSARMLSDNTVPTIYTGNDGVGIAFGENAHHLPREALQNGLIIDVRAAKILMEMGIDVGIEKIGDNIVNNLIHFTNSGEKVVSYYGEKSAFDLKLKDGAEIIAFTESKGKKYPDVIHYENADGQKFLVYAFDAAFTDESRYRNYCTQRQLYHSAEWLSGKKLPAKCQGSPDLYILCKKNENGMAIGLWNMFADEVLHPVIELDREYNTAEFIKCSGNLHGDKIELSEISPYGFAFINLK